MRRTGSTETFNNLVVAHTLKRLPVTMVSGGKSASTQVRGRLAVHLKNWWLNVFDLPLSRRLPSHSGHARSAANVRALQSAAVLLYPAGYRVTLRREDH